MFIRFCDYPIIAKYENGHIFAYAISQIGVENIQEYAYCHLQKRKIDIITQQTDSFLLYNETFLPSSMLQECIYNLKNNTLRKQNTAYQKMSIVGRIKLLYNKVKSKPIAPIILRLLRRIGVYPHSKYEK